MVQSNGYYTSYMPSSQYSNLSGNPSPPSAAPTATPLPANPYCYPTPQQVPFGNANLSHHYGHPQVYQQPNQQAQFQYGYASHHYGHPQVHQQPNPYNQWPYQNQQWGPQSNPHYNYQFHQPQISHHHSPIGHFQNEQKVSGKHHVRYTNAQVAILDAQFQKSSFIMGLNCKELSEATGLSEQQIKVWFNNKRRKMKKNIQKDLGKGHDDIHHQPNPHYQEPTDYQQSDPQSYTDSPYHPHKTQISHHQPISHPEHQHEVSGKYRVTYTKAQVAMLEEWFEKDKYIRKCDRVELEKVIGISERQIKIWFQNRRQKMKIWKEKSFTKKTDEENDN